MTDPDILDRIDDVIHWDGRSPDAMVWKAELPKPPFDPAMLQIDREAAQRLLGEVGGHVRAFADAFRPVAEQIARNFAAVTKAFTGLVNTPQMRELAQEQQRARSAMKSEYSRRRRQRSNRRTG